MKKSFKFAMLIFLLFILCFVGGNVKASNDSKIYCDATIDEEFSVDEILITLNKNVVIKKTYTEKDFEEIDCLEVKELTKDLWEEHRDINRILKLKVASTNKNDLLLKIHTLEKRNDLYHVSPNYILELAATCNDSRFSEQWGLDKISPYNAWNITTGSSSVSVGVLDSGIDGNHPDLKDNIDTYLSADFSDESINEDLFDPLVDKVGHGTHVAGIIGAVGNNDLGVSGVCWNINLISIKITNFKEFGIMSLISAIQYAEFHNIPLLNLSCSSKKNYTILEEAIKNYSGLVICAAGNDGDYVSVMASYPSIYQYDQILSVAASDGNDKKCEFSNYSKNYVDVLAPGYEILSTYPLLLDSSGYHVMSGTSMATPYVTGLAALLKSYNPNLTREDIKAAIMDGCDKVEELEKYCVSGGRINIQGAFEYFIHLHNYQYIYRDNKFHILTCFCGSTKGKLEVHVIKSEFILMPFAFCVDCHAKLDLRTDIGEGMLSLSIKKMTPNGSYYLSSGILVLAEEDIENYYSGIQIFKDKNQDLSS